MNNMSSDTHPPTKIDEHLRARREQQHWRARRYRRLSPRTATNKHKHKQTNAPGATANPQINAKRNDRRQPTREHNERERERERESKKENERGTSTPTNHHTDKQTCITDSHWGAQTTSPHIGKRKNEKACGAQTAQHKKAQRQARRNKQRRRHGGQNSHIWTYVSARKPKCRVCVCVPPNLSETVETQEKPRTESMKILKNDAMLGTMHYHADQISSVACKPTPTLTNA